MEEEIQSKKSQNQSKIIQNVDIQSQENIESSEYIGQCTNTPVFNMKSHCDQQRFIVSNRDINNKKSTFVLDHHSYRQERNLNNNENNDSNQVSFRNLLNSQRSEQQKSQEGKILIQDFLQNRENKTKEMYDSQQKDNKRQLQNIQQDSIIVKNYNDDNLSESSNSDKDYFSLQNSKFQFQQKENKQYKKGLPNLQLSQQQMSQSQIKQLQNIYGSGYVDYRGHQDSSTTHRGSFKMKSSQKMGISRIQSQIRQKSYSKIKTLTNLTFVPSKTLDPTSDFFIFWDLIHFLAIQFCLFFIPLQYTTKQNFHEGYSPLWMISLLCCLSVFVINILIKFNVGYYEKGLLINQRIEIFKHYASKELWIDLLGLYPIFDSIFQFEGAFKIFNFVIILKVYIIYGLFEKYGEMLQLHKNQIMFSLLEMVKLFFFIFMAAHFISTIYVGLAYHIDFDVSWIAKYGVEGNWFDHYLFALYWAVTTMTSVGYGDITPNTMNEIAYVSIIMFAACFTFGYCINVIGIIFENSTKRNKQYTKDMRIISRFLDQNKIEKDLQHEVRKYIEYTYQEDYHLTIQDQNYILKKMSSSLKKRLILQTNMNYIMKYQLLKEQFSNQFLQKLALNMTLCSYNNETNILESENNVLQQTSDNGRQIQLQYQKGKQHQDKEQQKNMTYNQLQIQNKIMELDQISLFFVTSGKLQIGVQYGQQFKVIKELERYDHFNHLDFFSEQLQQSFQIRSLGNSQLLKIDKYQFLKIIEEFPVDYQKYIMLKDSINILQNYQQLKNSCYNCKKYSHLFENCPKIHFDINKEVAILRNNYDEEHIHRIDDIEREPLKTESCRGFLQEIQECQEYIFNDLQENGEIENYYNLYLMEGNVDTALQNLGEFIESKANKEDLLNANLQQDINNNSGLRQGSIRNIKKVLSNKKSKSKFIQQNDAPPYSYQDLSQQDESQCQSFDTGENNNNNQKSVLNNPYTNNNIQRIRRLGSINKSISSPINRGQKKNSFLLNRQSSQYQNFDNLMQQQQMKVGQVYKPSGMKSFQEDNKIKSIKITYTNEDSSNEIEEHTIRNDIQIKNQHNKKFLGISQKQQKQDYKYNMFEKIQELAYQESDTPSAKETEQTIKNNSVKNDMNSIASREPRLNSRYSSRHSSNRTQTRNMKNNQQLFNNQNIKLTKTDSIELDLNNNLQQIQKQEENQQNNINNSDKQSISNKQNWFKSIYNSNKNNNNTGEQLNITKSILFRALFKQNQNLQGQDWEQIIKTDFPSVNTDKIFMKGYKYYFPQNNIKKVLKSYENKRNLFRRSSQYHLYFRYYQLKNGDIIQNKEKKELQIQQKKQKQNDTQQQEEKRAQQRQFYRQQRELRKNQRQSLQNFLKFNNNVLQISLNQHEENNINNLFLANSKLSNLNLHQPQSPQKKSLQSFNKGEGNISPIRKGGGKTPKGKNNQKSSFKVQFSKETNEGDTLNNNHQYDKNETTGKKRRKVSDSQQSQQQKVNFADQ